MSAQQGLGLQELRAALDAAVLRATGRRALTLRVPLAGPQLRCVHGGGGARGSVGRGGWRGLGVPGRPVGVGDPRAGPARPAWLQGLRSWSCQAAAPLFSPPSWLHREAVVQQVHVVPEAGAADVAVVISTAAHGRFLKLFPG